MRKLEGELRECYVVLLVEGRLHNALASIRYDVIPPILILHHFNFCLFSFLNERRLASGFRIRP